LEGPGSIVLAALGSIVLGALFATLDAGLSTLGDVRLRAIADDEGPHARVARRALADFGQIRSRLLVGRVLCLTTAAALAAHAANVIDGAGAAVIAAAVVALLYALVAETGAAVARRRAGTWAIAMLRWLRPLELLMVPFAGPISFLGRAVERAVPEAHMADPERVTELGLERVIEEGKEEGALVETQAELLRSVLEFKNTLAHEVMVPRTQMVAIEADTKLGSVVNLLVEQRHSRYPVYRGKIDQIIGILYAKDLFALVREGGYEERTADELVQKPVYFVSETQKIDSLLREMQLRRVHLAVVVDEFGGTSGIVTLEDIIEEIVGDIRDEYDDEESPVLEVAPGRYLVDAGLSVYDLEDKLGFAIHDEEGEYDSVGGMMIELAGHVPAIGETIETRDFVLTVRDGDQKRVRRVEIRRQDHAAAE
jgi:CBS domain containing-hemolysin-like protein